MDKAVLTVKLMAWPGWGVLAVTTVLAVLLASILALLLPFPDYSVEKQLRGHRDRLDLRSRLGLSAPLESYRTGLRRFNNWLDEWFGPPLSTQAFERCLAIAFIYPISIFLITLAVNGVTTGQIAPADFWIYLAGSIIGAFAAFKFLGLIIVGGQRVWGRFGGDADIVAVFVKICLGGLAVILAFAIAFSIASVMASELYAAGSVIFAVLGAFVFSILLAAVFAFAGIRAFAAVLAVAVISVFFFASEFAFVLLLFFVMIPVVNAAVDWLSWASTRWLLKEADAAPSGSVNGLLLFWGAVAGTAFAALGLIVLLAILLANAMELLKIAFSAIGQHGFTWMPLVSKAANAPWTDGLFVTGMLLTPLLPVFTHLTLGLTAVLSRFTPGSKAIAASITEHPYVTMTEDEAARVRTGVFWARFWYVPAFLAVFAVFVLIGAIVHVSGIQPSRLLQQLALCSTSWSHGACPA